MSSYTGHIKFLQGVDKHGAPAPEGFPFRFAVLTWLEYDGGIADPWPLMRRAVPRVAALLAADSVVGEYWLHQSKGILRKETEEKKVNEVRWNDLMARTDDELAEEEFPHRMRFIRGGRVLLHEESEMWSRVGGPSPYHDSVTLSFFSPRVMNKELEVIFADEASKIGIEVQEMGTG